MDAFADPDVCDTPWSEGYWPVKIEARLGWHAVDMMWW